LIRVYIHRSAADAAPTFDMAKSGRIRHEGQAPIRVGGKSEEAWFVADIEYSLTVKTTLRRDGASQEARDILFGEDPDERQVSALAEQIRVALRSYLSSGDWEREALEEVVNKL
jgi:hypothetical protein